MNKSAKELAAELAIDTAVGKASSCAKPDPSELTEDAVALAFTRHHGKTMRFDHDRNRWFEWRHDHWHLDETKRAFAYFRHLARNVSNGEKDRTLRAIRKASFADGVERFARSDPVHAVTSAEWDRDPMLLGCPGVTVDLRTGTCRPPDPADGITRLAGAQPREGDCPVWRAFLHEATAGDAEMIRFVQQWCGYNLTGETREHALVFIYGPGGNGKSAFIETLAHILGDYAMTAPMETFTASRSDRIPNDLAAMRGARMVSASETEEGRSWAEAKIKQLTGGDQVSARFMRGEWFTFTPTFKLTMVGNHKPHLKSPDDAARRRFNIVPFTTKPQTPDKELAKKLRAEAPQILQWMIAGCLDWQENGLMRPQTVLEATDEYFDDQDTFGTWLEERCRVEPGNRHLTARPKDLFSDWQVFAKAAGEEPGSQKSLGEALRKRGFDNGKRKVAGRSERIWFGLELLPTEGRSTCHD